MKDYHDDPIGKAASIYLTISYFHGWWTEPKKTMLWHIAIAVTVFIMYGVYRVWIKPRRELQRVELRLEAQELRRQNIQAYKEQEAAKVLRALQNK